MEISGSSGYYQSISTGQRINSAADDPAGLTISEEMNSQVRGYDQAGENAQYGQDLLKVAEGGLQNIQDSLQRMRELSIQASNTAILSDSDRSAIQDEIGQLKTSIQEAALGTEYNTMKLLDGSMADMNLAIHPSGNGMKIQLENTTLEALGIENYDVTGDFNIADIDAALEKVSSSRASLGSATNALEHVVNNNSNASLNLANARSRIKDADIGEEVSDLEQKRIIEQYQLLMQKKKMEQERQKLGLFT
ncbi:MAG: flagellin [Lachnoclostridium sp.]|jgi:flagellin|nr:flagellin [Lachnoclostridium sp.]